MDYSAEAEQRMLLEQAFNAADEEQVKKKTKETARARRTELDFVKQIMSTSHGRKWMYDLLTVVCKTFQTPIVPNETHYTYFYMGERNVGMKLFQDISEVASDEYVMMMKENK